MKKFFGILIFLFPTFIVFPQVKEELKKEAEFYRQEGYKLQCIGDLKGALEYYQKARQFDPSCVKVYNDLGVVYEMLGEEAKALEMYKQALQIDKRYLPVYTNLALFYEERGERERAIFYWWKRFCYGKKGEYWREVAKQHLYQLDVTGEIRRKILKFEQREFLRRFNSEVRELLSSKKEGKKKDWKYYLNKGKVLLEEGKYKEAIKVFKQAISVCPPEKALQMEVFELYEKAKRLYREEIRMLKEKVN